VTVIAILAALALPSYQQYIRQARRMDAMGDLLALQNAVEKCRGNEVTYDKCNDVDDSDGVFEVAPPENDYYDFAVTNTSTSASAWITSYTVEATAVSGTSQAADAPCTKLTLDQDGLKTPADGCWKK
jgi:type IV pilus assembly protein PilE